MSVLRGAVIGCGFFAVNQLNAWAEIEGAEIVAICDRDPARLALVGDQFGITARYTDARELLAAGGLDFVDIATTVQSHRHLVELAAAHRVPVICQKPFASSMGDARSMVASCESVGMPLMVHENFRWQSPIRAVKRELDGGAIGEPFWGRVTFRSAYDVFSGQPYLAEGERFIVEDLGIHVLDIARYLLGDVRTVTSRLRRVNPRIKGEDVATMLLDHENGATTVVDCSYATKLETELFPQSLVEIDGTEGTIRLTAGYQLTVTNGEGTRHLDVEPQVPAWGGKPWHVIQDSVRAIQQHWIDCLREGREPDTSGRDNVKTLALVEAAYLGDKARMPVHTDEV
jgi:predicted dehydrogenase